MSQQHPQQPQQPDWHGPPQQPVGPVPQAPKKRSKGKVVGFSCLGVLAFFVLIGALGAIVGDGDDKDDDTTNSAKGTAPASTAPTTPGAEKTDAPSEETDDVETTAPTPAASKTSTPDAATLGGDISRWVSSMNHHGVTWENQAAKETISGMPPTLNWFGEAKGATFSAPSFTASAFTDTNRQIRSLSCNAAGIPEGGSPQVAIFTDCITAAELDGIDNAKVRNWIQTKLPAMLGKDGLQVEHLQLAEATLSMDTAGNTAAIELSLDD
ncbi:hypothetical protein OG909_10670 [Streptomyces sp. NBC_01754]|uniref:hypothetical protein n=1 Tax=Streptomyces sp. NBC_01754 TaxID=2975930 RepID=UPI002DD9943D|nr:hypothetical protein [Streptomyces sp. NBC_01754]WSC92719.1 hypothetical protein OG909_10670 [Streptomyces sp. NBC_01754]